MAASASGCLRKVIVYWLIVNIFWYVAFEQYESHFYTSYTLNRDNIAHELIGKYHILQNNNTKVFWGW